MFLLFLVLLSVIMLFFTFSSFSDKKRIFVLLAESVSVFLCLFAIVSAVLWMFNLFTIEFCVLTVTIIATIAFAIVYYKIGRNKKDFFSIGPIRTDYSIIIDRSIIIVATLLSLGAYSTIGIGYNDGNARNQAISIINNQNSLQFVIDEYGEIEPGSVYEYYFFKTISEIGGDNFTADYLTKHIDSEEGKTSEMLGEYGSNPVYPSILALSGTLLGTKRMAFVQAVFAFCLFVFADEILRILGCDWKLRSALVLLIGVSPVYVYCNHTTLAEPLLGFCIITFMYFLLCKKDRLQILSVLGAITFSVIHSGVYIILPLFLILYWMYYVHTGKFRHLLSSGVMIIGYVISYIFLNITAYENTVINYRLGMPFLGNKTYIYVIIIFAVTLLVGVILSIIVKTADLNKLNEFKKKNCSKIFKILMAICAIIPIPVIAFIVIQNSYSFEEFLKITFVAFVVCSGLIIIPYIIFRLVSARYHAGIREASIIVVFAYTIILYSCVMRTMIDGYYYGARYLSSFIPFIVLTAGIMLKALKNEEKYFIPVIGILIMLIPYTSVLQNTRTETRFDNDIYEDVMEVVEKNADENTIVLVENELLKYYYFPLLQSSDARIFPIEEGYIEYLCKGINDFTSKVIYITDDKGNEYAAKGDVKYLNYNIQNKSLAKNTSTFLGLPNTFSEGKGSKIQVLEIDALYKIVNYDLFDDMEINDFDLSVKSVEITDEGMAHIIVSLTDGSKLYHNDKFSLSYHLEYENAEDEYENPRINFGSVTSVDYLIDVDLESQPEDVTVVIDVVEEGVAWYSYEHKVPIIVFNETKQGWEYKTYKFFTKLK